MSTSTIVFLVIIVVLIAALVALYFFGKKAQRRQAAQQEQMEAIAQTVSMLIIDKKKLKISQSGLPAQVIEQTPKWLRWNKLPIVKAKVGPKIMTLACDANVFEVSSCEKGSEGRGQRHLHHRSEERERRPGGSGKEKRLF